MVFRLAQEAEVFELRCCVPPPPPGSPLGFGHSYTRWSVRLAAGAPESYALSTAAVAAAFEAYYRTAGNATALELRLAVRNIGTVAS